MFRKLWAIAPTLIFVGCGSESSDEAQVLTIRNLEGTYELSEGRCSRADEVTHQDDRPISTRLSISTDSAEFSDTYSSGCTVMYRGKISRVGANRINFVGESKSCTTICSSAECSLDRDQKSFLVSSFTNSKLILRESDSQTCSEEGGYRVSIYARNS